MDNFFLNPRNINYVTSHALNLLNAMSMSGKDIYQAGSHVSDNVQDQYEIKDGTAIIDVRGSITSEIISNGRWFGENTYEGIIRKLEGAVDNSAVDRILIRFHSPGGTVTGCAEAADRINELSKQKDIWSFCTLADSAAYWLASSTNRIIVEQTSEVGSIGVIMTHMDVSKLLEEWGVKFTHIFSGKHKADGSPYKPLSDEAMERYQKELDLFRGMFVNAVALNRNMSVEDVHNTEALTFHGEEMLSSGLADDMMFFNKVLSEFASFVPTPQSQTNLKETNMKKNYSKSNGPTNSSNEDEGALASTAASTEENDAEETSEDAPEDESDDPAIEDGDDSEEGETEGTSDEEASASSNEKQRISAILSCEEGQGMDNLCRSLALNSNVTLGEAKKHLLAAKEDSASSSSDPLGSAMEGVQNPNVSNMNGEKEDDSNPLIAAQQTYRPTTLRKS